MSDLLLETGDHLLLEDGSSALLLEQEAAGVVWLVGPCALTAVGGAATLTYAPAEVGYVSTRSRRPVVVRPKRRTYTLVAGPGAWSAVGSATTVATGAAAPTRRRTGVVPGGRIRRGLPLAADDAVRRWRWRDRGGGRSSYSPVDRTRAARGAQLRCVGAPVRLVWSPPSIAVLDARRDAAARPPVTWTCGAAAVRTIGAQLVTRVDRVRLCQAVRTDVAFGAAILTWTPTTPARVRRARAIAAADDEWLWLQEVA